MENTDCKCLKRTEEQIIEMMNTREKKPKGFKIIDSEWEHKTWYPHMRLYANYILTFIFEKANGTTSKPRKDHVNIHFTFCPFCGKKFENEVETK